jgi:transcriptional regulator GlxA family with amidase domain
MSIKDERKRASREKLKRKNARSRMVPKRAIHDARVRIVIDFMQDNLHRKISLTDFGEAASLSGTYLARIFKTETGLSPIEYLIRLRMEKARHLLKTTLLSIKEIMALTGYSNRGHFIQHFSRYYGPVPSEFRRSVSSS